MYSLRSFVYCQIFRQCHLNAMRAHFFHVLRRQQLEQQIFAAYLAVQIRCLLACSQSANLPCPNRIMGQMPFPPQEIAAESPLLVTFQNFRGFMHAVYIEI